MDDVNIGGSNKSESLQGSRRHMGQTISAGWFAEAPAWLILWGSLNVLRQCPLHILLLFVLVHFKQGE